MSFSRNFGLAAVAAAMTTVALVMPTEAAPKNSVVVLDGVAALHGVIRVGKKVCFDEHYHYGSSSGMATKAAAQKAAVASWYQLVNLEYGDAWSSFRKSYKQKMTCSQSGGGWGCDVESIPCR